MGLGKVSLRLNGGSGRAGPLHPLHVLLIVQTNQRTEVMYEVMLKYQGWFYASRMQRPDLFTALGAVLESHEHTAVQWYRVRALVSEESASAPAEKAEEAHLAERATSPCQ